MTPDQLVALLMTIADLRLACQEATQRAEAAEAQLAALATPPSPEAT